jgi:hypothetical protein
MRLPPGLLGARHPRAAVVAERRHHLSSSYSTIGIITAHPARLKPLETLEFSGHCCRRVGMTMISSTIPSAKYSCSGSPLRLSKGRTAIEGLLGRGGEAPITGAPVGYSAPLTRYA